MAAVSEFREHDNRLGWQQCGIASTLPVLDAGFSYWKRPRKIFPPRGYAYAILDGGGKIPPELALKVGQKIKVPVREVK